jgi:pyruvate/2-oxoglutarate dehydrogenase complex dihydrolipoamide acyltransferase (E2) component
MRGNRLTGWRRIATAMWDAPEDPQIFGALEIDAEKLQQFIDRARLAGHHITATHLVARAVAHALERVPDLNVQIRNGFARPRPSVDVFVITAVAGGRDLSGIKVSDVPNKPAIAVAEELAVRVGRLKRGEDREFTRTKRLSDRLPIWLLRRALRASAFLSETLRLDIPALGLRRTPFGSAMITNVAMFGLPQGFAPLAWMYDVPLLVLVGEIAERPVVVDGRVVARPVLPVTATIDHRYVDGWHVGQAMAAFREYLADPQMFEPALSAREQPRRHEAP